MSLRLSIIAILLSMWLLPVCAQRYPMKTYGYASYYHDALHGRKMANGKPYSRDSMTCAHLRFPLGTILRVRNMQNGKEIEVEVTDRGPYSNRFVIDLSRRAASELGVIKRPLNKVLLTPLGNRHIPFRLVEPKTERDTMVVYLVPYGEPLWAEWEEFYLESRE